MVSRLLGPITAVLLVLVAPIQASARQGVSGIDIQARQAFMMDFDTGAVLLAKDADSRMYPASMTKLMTAYLVFERLKNGTLSLDDAFPVSEKAWHKQGSKMFVEVGTRVRIEDLLYGLIVQSGNDASIVLAEGIAGSEAAFARMMTEKARELGMAHTQFRNASGWPDEEHYTTARDMAILARILIRNFPEYYHFYSTREFTYSGITQQNRNPLLGREIGADGLKTGYTDASGYGLTASAKRGDQRLILVVNGLDSAKERRLEAGRLLDWGFRAFGTFRLFDPGETVAEIPVWLGTAAHVPAIVETAVEIVLRRSARDDMQVILKTKEPVSAPIGPGTPLGTVEITAPGLETVTAPVVAGAAVGRLGSIGRLKAALEYLVFGG